MTVPPADRRFAGPPVGGVAGGGEPRGFVDLHTHLLPAVDDGAADEAEAAAGLARLRDEGIVALAVTPHFEAALQKRPPECAARMDAIDRGWARFEMLLDGTGVTAVRGVELRLDLAQPDASDPRLRIAGGRFVLCEFPWFMVPPRSDRVIAGLHDAGWLPIIAHPERYAGLEDDPAVVESWLEAGAFLQVNGGSLLGRYGRTARHTATRLLEQGLVSYVASDYHARGAPGVREYHEVLVRLLGEDAAASLMEGNPARLLRGEAPLPVTADRGAA